MQFELTNTDRKYLGLNPLNNDWVKTQLTKEIYLYFEGKYIRKSVTICDNLYREDDMNEETGENRTLLMPKTKRGKPKKLNYSSFQARRGTGTYFLFEAGKYGVTIGNYTTQKTFYSTNFEGIEIADFVELRKWLNDFIKTSPKSHLNDIKLFGKEERQNVKIKEGDFFSFKVDRYNYGFGRVLLDIRKLRKEKVFEKENHYGLANIMCKPLTVKVYHKVNPTKDIDLNELKKCRSFPSKHIMDNRIFYGEYEIIGHIKLENYELDFPISFSQSIYYKDPDTIYCQWGLIYYEKNIKNVSKEILGKYFRADGVGLGLSINKNILEKCIKDNSNHYYWNNKDLRSAEKDLRNPNNIKYKKKIFHEFGLNPNLEYHENALRHAKQIF